MQESSLRDFEAANIITWFCQLLLVQLYNREPILNYQKEYSLLLHNFDMFHVPYSAFRVVDKEDSILVLMQQDLMFHLA